MAGSFITKKTLKNGDVRYKATITYQSRNFKTQTFRLKRDASDWASRFISNIENFAATGKRPCDVSFEELADQYIKEWQGTDAVRVRYVLRFKEYFGNKLINKITSSDCRDSLRQYETLKPSTYNKHKAVLSAVFKFAQQKNLDSDRGYIEHNPMNSIISKPMKNERVRYLSPAEKKRLLSACKDIGGKFYLAFLLALTTGQRKSNILHRKWSDIDLERGLIDIRETKNDDPIMAPIPDFVLKLLNEHAETEDLSGLIFASSVDKSVPSGFRKEWKQAREAAKVDNFTWHDMRHDVASALAMSGATIIEIADILGHRSLQSTKRYAHLSTSHKAKVLSQTMNESLAAFI